jgi:RNA polymerase sigma factor (sigma-70 family)
MANLNWTDDALAEAVRQGGREREAALHRLYQKPGLRETVVRHVLDHGGSHQDAQDVFQESFVLLDRNLREGRFEGKSALSTYFVAIAKWHWVGLRRRQGRYQELTASAYEGSVDSPEAETIGSEQRSLLAAGLEQIGERCKSLLQLYQLEYSMDEIADVMGYQNADVAKKEAYRCRIKLREALERQPYWAEYKNKV